jgi:AraC family transcriptional regulator
MINYEVDMKTEVRSIQIIGTAKTLKNGRSEIADFWKSVTTSGQLEQMYQSSDLNDPHFFGISIMEPDNLQYIIGVDSSEQSEIFDSFKIASATWFKFSGSGKLPDAIQELQEKIWQEHGQEIAASSEQRDVAINIEEYYDMTPDFSKFNILIPQSKIIIKH